MKNIEDQRITKKDVLWEQEHPSITLSVFEGPLDLLLFLIRRHEIDIYDIPIEKITNQYLDIINNQSELNLEVAGEFFVMAASLMLIKSKMLLPQQKNIDDEDELQLEDDPRWELVQQLLEYKKLKEESTLLSNLINNRQQFVLREYIEDNIEKSLRPLKNSDKMAIWSAFNNVLIRLSVKLSGEIFDEAITIASQMDLILTKMKTSSKFLFTEILNKENININFIISTFLALLELCRLDKLYLSQTNNFDDIECLARE